MMPWCPSCERYLSPPSVRRDGSCPTCARSVDPGRAAAAAVEIDSGDRSVEEDSPPIPWHLKALVAALVLYLGWRSFQGVEWLVGRF